MCKWYLRDDLVVKNKNSLKVTQIDKDSFFKKKNLYYLTNFWDRKYSQAL